MESGVGTMTGGPGRNGGDPVGGIEGLALVNPRAPAGV